MKLLIKYAGKRKRTIIDAEPNMLIGDLKKEIALRFRLIYVGFRLVYTICYNFKVLLTDSFPISFFEINHGSIIEVDVYGYQKILKKNKCRGSTYLESVGASIKYKIPEHTKFEDLIETCKLGNHRAFIMIAEMHSRMYPDEDILNQVHPSLWSPFHYACYYGISEITSYLVTKSVNVNRVTIDEWTPLQLASYMGHYNCVLSLTHHKNLQINKTTKFRGTPLHLACERNHKDIVKLLIDNLAFIILKDHNGMTPFDLTSDHEIHHLLAVAAGNEELRKCSEEKPENMIGHISLSSAFFIHNRKVILELNVEKGFLYQFSLEAYKEKTLPELTIKIGDIQDVRQEPNWFFSLKEEYNFVIETSNSTSRYSLKKKELTEEWVRRLKKAANYFILHPGGLDTDPHDTKANDMSIEDQKCMSKKPSIKEQELNLSSFEALDELGNGSFGTVLKVKKKTETEAGCEEPETFYAMKILSILSLQKKKQLKYAISEIKIMKRLNHPFILKLHYAFQDPKNVYMILEYCPNGDLLNLIQKKGRLDEQTSRFYISEIILALEYLHAKDIIYRDLKPSNILLDKEGHIKMADFGLAKENVNEMNPARTVAGSPAYLPPETLSESGTSKPADIYGLGALLYEMLTGYPPYYSKNIDMLFESIKNANLEFPSYVSASAKYFISAVMNRVPEKRPSLNALKHYLFFRKLDWDALLNKKIKPPKLVKAYTAYIQEDNFTS
ncbi:hypothetical protein SteCoe_5839 [Stentor coeruleus]|uniref:Non-specific serine/threonine protein kinase n=1 Tax=Stentor coeruleus TaxID=5963 RepID=A0A1R2CRG0_9CILI|nr:hypothetical protein SteCoe_5839 [Stentor coeruleus]